MFGRHPLFGVNSATGGGGGGGVWTTALLASPANNSDAWNGYTLSQDIDAPALADLLGSQARFNIAASSAEALGITKVRIGLRGGGGVNTYAATPAAVLLNGGSASATIAANTQLTTDAVSIALDGTLPIVIRYYINGGSGADAIRFAATSGCKVHYKSGDHVDVTGSLSGWTAWDGGADRLVTPKVELLV